MPTPSAPTRFRIRRDGWTIPRQRLFLMTLAGTGCVKTACARVGLSQASVYRLRRNPALTGFAKGWELAMANFIEHARERMMEHALNSLHVPAMRGGKRVKTGAAATDRARMFVLRTYDAPRQPFIEADPTEDLIADLANLHDIDAY